MTRSSPRNHKLQVKGQAKPRKDHGRLIDGYRSKKDIAHKKFKKPFVTPTNDFGKRVVGILDFKKQSDQIFYLVQREGDLEGSWENETSIEAQNMLFDYQKKVYQEAGYSFQGENQGRLSRLSKARAVMAIKAADYTMALADDDSDEFKSGTKRKTSSGSNRSHTKKGKSTSGRKTKAALALEAQKEKRQARKIRRETIDTDAIMKEIEGNNANDCCLACAAGSYKKCLEKDDIKGFETAFDDVDHVPAPSNDNQYELGLLGYSIALGKTQFTKLIDEKEKAFVTKPTKRPEIPARYIAQNDSTGSNYGKGAYGRMAFRQVQISRGNRQGDSAFYRNPGTIVEDYKMHQDLDGQLSGNRIEGFMSYITKPVFQDPNTIYSYKDYVYSFSGPNDVYYAVEAGSRLLACELMQTDLHGRTPFNSLHVETLEFTGGKPLGYYRKPQILKSAFDAKGLTPFHCAAINPSRIYLQEFYEALDSSERLKLDNCGRTVIFFAAASETSDCLEYLISQGVSVTQMDKYRVTPLVQAVRFGRSHNVEIIIKHLNEGKSNGEDSSDIFQTLIRNKKTLLHLAAFFGHVETCRILICHGCPVESVESLDKQTALMYAAKNGHLDCVRVLIEEGGADPEKGDKYLKNALHMACIGGHFEVVKYFLSQGLDADAPDSSQNRPSHYATAYGHLDILHLLINYGQANPGYSSVWRTTPCSIANVKGHVAIVKYLLNLPGDDININFKNDEGRTMLQHTVNEPASNVQDREFNAKKAKLLISMNADVNSTDIYGDTCLHLIAKNTAYIRCLPRFYESFYPKKRREANRYDLRSENKARVFEEDDQDGIAYQEKLAGLLVLHGGHIHIKNQEGETPLASAMRLNNHPIITLLIDSGAKYWEDVDKDGNNFIHYFTRFVAYINQLQPHRDLDQVQKDRLLASADTMWKAIEKNQPPNGTMELMASAANNEGFPPIVYGTYTAINLQKLAMTREKLMIQQTVDYPYQYSSKYREKYDVDAEEARNHEVNLTLSFDLWIKYMELVLQMFRCDINGVVACPKDFKKKKCDTQKLQYPKLTGYGAIHLAAQAQCSDLVHFLLKHGCNPNLKVNVEGVLGKTPMIIAYHQKSDKRQELPDNQSEAMEEINKRFTLIKPDFPDMLRKTIGTLIQYHGSPYVITNGDCSPITKAASNMDLDNIKEMCKAVPLDEANINTMDENGETSLMVAVANFSELVKKKEKLDTEIIRCLLLANADPNVQCEDGDTIFMKAIKTSHAILVRTFLENTQVKIQHHIKNKCFENALILACSLNQNDIVADYIAYLKSTQDPSSLPLNTCETRGASPLSSAASHGNLEVVQLLLSLGSDPNFCSHGVLPLSQAVRSKNVQVVKVLLEAGADVDCRTLKGNTALHIAVYTEKHQMVKLLLEYGADCNAVNNDKKSPIHFAIEATKKQKNRSFRVERLLIAAGAHLNSKDNFGRTPLHYAFVKMDFVPLNRQTVIVAKKLQQISKELEDEKKREEGLLHFLNKYSLDPSSTADTWLEASKRKQLEQEDVEAKIKKDVEEEIPMTDEEKEFIKRYKVCNFEAESDRHERFDPIDIVKYLVDHKGIDYEAQDVFGRTPLHYAACVGAFSCSTILIGKNININAMDVDQNGPLQLALQNDHVDYAIMLCNLGASCGNRVTMRNGKESTTFGYSLSISVINLAYLIMERGISLLESIQDSLINGKFHMVELLLKASQNEALSGVLEEKNQNIWHIISDFTPFDSEIWLEYLDEIITRITPLNLSIFPDKHMRTPLHYAAKHGQTTLLNHLLSLGSINVYDENDKSELYYAVESGNTESVQTLIHAGADICGQKGFKNDSMLLKATKANQLDTVRLLLKHGVATDEDSQYGRPNSVMTACQNANIDILKALIEAKANLDTPSIIERKDKSGKKLSVLIHPAFVASLKTDKSIFKMLLASGANPSVYGPNVYPEYGRSLLMFNVFMDQIDNQKILLEQKVDLNMQDGPKNRSVFYQFLFSQLGIDKTNKEKNKEVPCFNFKDFIFNQMIKEHNPQVSFIDEASGITPLEAAIIKDSSFVTERLLLLNANPNIESCYKYSEPGFSSFIRMSQIRIPAVLHAVLQNNLKIVTIICQQTKVPIHWLWQDDKKRNMLTYLFGCTNGYSTENTFMLEYLKGAMGDDTFREALHMVDSYNRTPVTYAYHRANKYLYECLTRLESTVKTIDLEIQDNNNDRTEDPMEVDFVSMDQIDEDAQIERTLLQKEADAKKKKVKAIKSDDIKTKVDEYSKLGRVGYVECDENDEPYDTMLLKVDITSWNGAESSFYKMSIIRNKVLDLYILWTRWGPFGEEGQHQRTPYLLKEEAVSEFKAIFKAKTANMWEDRASFEGKPGKYEILKESQHPRDTLLKNFDFMASSKPSNLPIGVMSVMKLICNYQYLSRVYKDTAIDMPMGQVSQKHIQRASTVLMEAKEINDKYFAAKQNFRDREQIQLSKSYGFQLAQKCLEYSRLMPHTDQSNNLVRSLLHDKFSYYYRLTSYEKELAKMLDLSYVGFAANVILAAKHRMEEISPLDYAYRALNCSLRELKNYETEYSMIKFYMSSTSKDQELINVFAVQRGEEEARFRPYENDPNRMLLWHGSKIGNLMGILKQGLRGAPSTTTNNGALLGTGVYFADSFAKSIGYCEDYYMSTSSPYKIMLLCEVALGKIQTYEDFRGIDSTQYDSVQALGEKIPNPFNTVFDKRGARVTFGPCIKNNSPELEKSNTQLKYNEYMVHAENRVKIRYLLIVKDRSTCSLCFHATNGNNVKPFKNHEFSKYGYNHFNNYEKELVMAYLTHQQKSLKNIFDSDIEDYVENGEYKKKWNIPLEVTLESKVCTSCCDYVMAMILETRMTNSDCSIDIPDTISQRPLCKYGQECRTQNKVSHAKDYQHWLKKNQTKDVIQASDEETCEDDSNDSMDTDEE